MLDLNSIHNRKVAVIGAGNVGASIAYALTIRNLATEIILIDVDEKRAEGEALDIQHGIPYMGMSSVKHGSYEDIKECDLIIITAGRNRRVGESRLDLAADNIKILRNITDSMKPYYDKCAILIVANPVDILTKKCDEFIREDFHDLPDGMVFGTGNILDTSRLTRIVADYTGLNTEVVKGQIVGEHGDGQVTIWSKMSIAGDPIDDYCSDVNLEWNDEIKKDIENKVKGLGAEIIADKGKTHYGIATCVCYIADAVLNQRLTIASVSSVLKGEYGVDGVSLSVPSIIGVNGVERRLEERWTDEEYKQFKESADRLKGFLEQLK